MAAAMNAPNSGASSSGSGSGSGSGSASGSGSVSVSVSGSDKWYFTRDQLANSPSRQCGLDADKELAYRQQAANLIQDMGQRLQVSQLCINTAIVYMHRFYAFHSFTQFHRNQMAAAALFLAAKVEEQPRKLEHVIKVSHICLHRGDNQTSLDIQSKSYLDQAQDLVFNENVLLQTLGFDVAIDHPHTHVVRTCNLVRASKDLAQTSYFMASNSLHLTTMCLQYRPTVVACFCIHLASKWSNWAIPQSNEGKHWFYYVDRTVTSDLLEHLTSEFLHIFDRCPARLKKKIMSISNTQGTNSPQQAGSSHSNPGVQSSPFDKEPKKIMMEDMEKAEAEKRQGLFGPSMSSNTSQMVSVSNKMDYREYKERQQQQDRRRPPNMPPSNMVPRPSQDIPGNSQHRQSSSSSQRSQNMPSSQNRWPANHRSKEVVSMRPHPSQSSSSSSSSRPPHRSSSSVHPPQIPTSQSIQPIPEQKSRSQHPPQQSLLHSSRIHPSAPPQQIVQQPMQQPHQSHPQVPSQTLQQNIQIPVQQPPQRPPSLFSPEPQRKPSVPRRPPAPLLPSKELLIPSTLLSPFSTSPPLLPQPLSEIEPLPVPRKVEEPPPVETPSAPPPPPVIPNNLETDPTLISSLLKESLPHKADKKKKKDKHKHKDRDKREERRKHKKDKDKKRDSESSSVPPVPVTAAPPPQNSSQSAATSLKITIPREAVTNIAPPNPTKLKIKIAKERLRTEPPVSVQQSQPPLPPTTTALKIKIPKEYVDSSRKRPSPGGMILEGQAQKVSRMSQQSHPHHKTSYDMVMGNGQSGSYK